MLTVGLVHRSCLEHWEACLEMQTRALTKASADLPNASAALQVSLNGLLRLSECPRCNNQTLWRVEVNQVTG
ncbi:unnamed protein product [Protopolystoma xenopodis]|uniref:Uncharacterized protein n=1 Tax=Protopolystoma xenopodis TaxID=117903 RepID=A0A448XML6_9PLAT|nr:unnamed protein product [Protopolystoma xenopodis]